MQKYPEFKILIIDDEEDARIAMETALLSYGINNIILAENGNDVIRIIKDNCVSIVILDLIMPGSPGEEILELIKEEYPQITVIITTGKNEINSAIRCMKTGAYDYLLKPIDIETLQACVKRAIELQHLIGENTKIKTSFFKNTPSNPDSFSQMITASSKMMSIFKYAEAIASGKQTVLITGETGTGKELMALAIHKLGRSSGKFVAVNIAELESAMIADSLFGHIKGAYTGAEAKRDGFVETAKDGTLFLDEIGELNKEVQVKLLRLLEEREYIALGSDIPKISTARIITATNQNLEKLVSEGKFRKDLFFRLKTHNIEIPPLRERPDDIPLLFEQFMEKACKEFEKDKPEINSDLIPALKNYDFPGNIRELKSMIFDAVGSGGKKLKKEHFPALKNIHLDKRATLPNPTKRLPTIKQAINELIAEAMAISDGNQSAAAKILGITHQALSKRLKALE